MDAAQEYRISQLFGNYARSWGPIAWRKDCAQVKKHEDRSFGEMLHALALIESDSVIMRRKLAATRADRSNPVKQFNVLWLAEETEHGRALSAAGRQMGVDGVDAPDGRNLRDLRSITTWPALYMSGFFIPHLEATYCTLGSVQEFIALSTYRALGQAARDPALDRLLRQIARQEGRHMRFYRGAAQILLDSHKARWVTAQLISRLWRPPGVDLLGLPRWLNIFAPLLRQPAYRRTLLHVDSLLMDLVGASVGRPMQRFIETWVTSIGIESPVANLSGGKYGNL